MSIFVVIGKTTSTFGVIQMISMIKAEHVSDYKIFVVFSNDQKGIVDLEESLWGPVFDPLKNIEEFKKFNVSKIYKTIIWECGADLAPEYLYDKLIQQNKHAA